MQVNILILVAYGVGLLVALLAATLFRARTRGLVVVLLGAVAGAIALGVLIYFEVAPYSATALNAFFVGILGAVGLLVILWLG